MAKLHLAQEILDIIYPVGSIYMSVNSTNPKNLFGGTWVAWGTGRVPVGIDTSQTEFASVEKTGGEKTHELTINQIPSHQHNIQGANSSGSSVNWTDRAVSYSSDAVGYNAGVRTNYQGGSEAHNNLQPYITCYMWKRTA